MIQVKTFENDRSAEWAQAKANSWLQAHQDKIDNVVVHPVHFTVNPPTPNEDRHWYFVLTIQYETKEAFDPGRA